MPVQYFDSPSIPLTYEQLTGWAVDVNNAQGYNVIEYLNYINTAYPDVDLTDFMLEETDRVFDYVQNGDGTYTVLGYRTPIQDTVISDPFNSNTSQVSRGTIRQAINDGVQDVGGTISRHMTTFPASGSFTQQASYVIGSVGSAIAAVSAGITLGKIIDSALYNANPDYWNSIGMQSLNPETWNSITNGDDSAFAGLFNLILGLDPTTGKSQMYMDENAFAYLAYALSQNGWFTSGGTVVTPPDNFPYADYPTTGFSCIDISSSPTVIGSAVSDGTPVTIRTSGKNAKVCFKNLGGSYGMIIASDVSGGLYFIESPTQASGVGGAGGAGNTAITIDNKTAYYTYAGISSSNYIPLVTIPEVYNNYNDLNSWVMVYGDVHTNTPIEGTDNQPNATLPDDSTWDSPQNTLPSLQQQYPDLWDNAIGFDNIQPDGTVNRTTYVPVAMPSFQYNNDQQPISGTQPQTQTSTEYDPATTDPTILQLLTDLITATDTQTSPEPSIPPTNPVDTGTGETGPVTPPTGNASALWSVYHPTQAQVNSFGAWLWGSPFLTNIGKLFQNPIDGVISLHKIFATPVDSGSGTIVVGTLDSEVPSATVNQQYVYVNCGSINCYEYFGNVFDYPPYTQVSLYLPFIGIVPLDANDVMRSSINVTYGVDVYTGACLAMVTVSRDGCEVNMYQYAGVASVEYPLSNVQNGQLVSGLLAIGAGVASMIATGGITAPAVGAVAAGVATSAKSSVSKSGGFSGNSGAMGIKIPYLIIQRPQTKVADSFVYLNGYPTNISGKLNEFSGQVRVSHVHVEGISATDTELAQIETLLKDGVLI